MASPARRAAHLTLAGAASLAAVGVTAPTVQAAEADNVWDRVADCESSGNWSINTGNGFYGGLQFWHPTWKSFGGEEFAPYAHQASKIQQITVAQRVLKVQGPGAWPVCSVRAGLTMENGSAPYPGGDTPAPPAPAPVGTWWVAAQPGANIRSGPSTTYAVVGTASTGTTVTGTLSNGWVKLADGRGWISAATLTTTEPTLPAPTPPPPSSTTSWTVTATAGANIRSGPGTTYSVVGGAAHGTTVTGTLSNGWVQLADGRGWISGSILGPVGSGGGGGGGASDMAPLVVDGSRGPLTVKAIQRWAGVAETGTWDTATIKALQKTVGVTQDGSWGPASQAALQTRIGMTRDGSTYMNYRTVVALQQWLNANVIG